MLFRNTLLAAAGLFSLVHAGDVLSTDGYQACSNDTDIKVNKFNVKYDRATMKVTFDVGGSSKKSQNVIAELRVSAYGRSLYNRTFDPCDEKQKVKLLCPVPVGDFSASGELPIPPEFASQIPGIAFQVPDLDGTARLYLRAKDGNGVVACLQSGVRNGKTANQPAVKLVTAGIAAAALVLGGVSAAGAAAAGAGAHSPGGSSGPSPNAGDVMLWFQSVATNGMLSVNYPPVYRSFTKNFGWATGLIPWDDMQRSIDNFRGKTGGNLTSSSVDELRNSSLVFQGESTTKLSKRSVDDLFELVRRQNINLNGGSVTANVNGTSINTGGKTDADSSFDTKVTKTVHGLQGYVEQLKIPSANTFLTVLLVFCIVLAACAVLILLFKLILELYGMCGKLGKGLQSFRKRYWLFLGGTMLRIILVLYGIWVIYCLYQFRVGDSWAARLLAGLTLALFTGLLGFFAVRITMLARRFKRLEGSSEQLFDDKKNLRRYGLFYDQYKSTFWWVFIPLIVYLFLKGAFIALGDGHGIVQTGGQLGCEVMLLILLIFARPFNSKAGNVINIIIAVVRVLSVGCILVFVEELNIGSDTKTVFGLVLIIVQSVLSAVLFILIVVNAIIVCCKENPHKKRRRLQEKMAEEARARDNLTPLDARNSLIDPASYVNRGDGKGKYQPTPTHDNFQMDEYPNVPPPNRYDAPGAHPGNPAFHHDRSMSPQYGAPYDPGSDANLVGGAAPMGHAPAGVNNGFVGYEQYRGSPPGQFYGQHPH